MSGNLTGDFDVLGAVTIRGGGAGVTVIDGQQRDRVIDVAGTARGPFESSSRISLSGTGDAGHGGGIWVGNADPWCVTPQ